MANISRFRLDTSAYRFMGATETVRPKFDYIDGEKSTLQATNDKGENLWSLDCTIIDDVNKVSDTARVTVASNTEPSISFMEEIKFTGLSMLAYAPSDSYGVSYSFTADGLETTSTSSKSKSKSSSTNYAGV